MSKLYRNAHHSQYEAGSSPITRRAGCTWTAGASGVDAATGGARNPSPDTVHDLLRRDEETSPATPGWSLTDLVRALDRMGIELVDHTGEGWPAVVAQLDAGHYVVLQGDSDRFGNQTCSGSFDGDHAIGVHPDSRTAFDAVRERWINDPVCPAGRWEREDVLRAYARKLWPPVRFAAFAAAVPPRDPEPVNPEPGTGDANVTIRYVPAVESSRTMRLAKGQYLYASPGGARVTSMQATRDVPYLGHAGGVKGKPWRAVIVSTGALYVDKSPRPTVLYVPDAAGPITPAED